MQIKVLARFCTHTKAITREGFNFVFTTRNENTFWGLVLYLKIYKYNSAISSTTATRCSSMILEKCNLLFGNQTTFMEKSMMNNLLTVFVFTSVINPFTNDIV